MTPDFGSLKSQAKIEDHNLSRNPYRRGIVVILSQKPYHRGLGGHAKMVLHERHFLLNKDTMANLAIRAEFGDASSVCVTEDEKEEDDDDGSLAASSAPAGPLNVTSGPSTAQTCTDASGAYVKSGPSIAQTCIDANGAKSTFGCGSTVAQEEPVGMDYVPHAYHFAFLHHDPSMCFFSACGHLLDTVVHSTSVPLGSASDQLYFPVILRRGSDEASVGTTCSQHQ